MKPDFKISEFSLRQNFCSPGTSSSAFAGDGEYQYVIKHLLWVTVWRRIEY